MPSTPPAAALLLLPRSRRFPHTLKLPRPSTALRALKTDTPSTPPSLRNPATATAAPTPTRSLPPRPAANRPTPPRLPGVIRPQHLPDPRDLTRSGFAHVSREATVPFKHPSTRGAPKAPYTPDASKILKDIKRLHQYGDTSTIRPEEFRQVLFALAQDRVGLAKGHEELQKLALFVFQAAKDGGFEPDFPCYVALLTVVARGSNLDRVEEVLQMMVSAEFNVEAPVVLEQRAIAFANADEIGAAEAACYRLMGTHIVGTAPISLRDIAVPLLAAYVRGKRRNDDMAKHLFASVKWGVEDGRRLRKAYGKAIMYYAMHQEREQAEALLKESLGRTKEPVEAAAWNALMQMNVQAMEPGRVPALFRDMLKTGRVPDEATLFTAVSAASDLHDPAFGWEVAAQLLKTNSRPHSKKFFGRLALATGPPTATSLASLPALLRQSDIPPTHDRAALQFLLDGYRENRDGPSVSALLTDLATRGWLDARAVEVGTAGLAWHNLHSALDLVRRALADNMPLSQRPFTTLLLRILDERVVDSSLLAEELDEVLGWIRKVEVKHTEYLLSNIMLLTRNDPEGRDRVMDAIRMQLSILVVALIIETLSAPDHSRLGPYPPFLRAKCSPFYRALSQRLRPRPSLPFSGFSPPFDRPSAMCSRRAPFSTTPPPSAHLSVGLLQVSGFLHSALHIPSQPLPIFARTRFSRSGFCFLGHPVFGFAPPCVSCSVL
ncbi:hypothetical protein BDK51DRAFT_38374 [Blyttiomyces helicus]|uniref:Pentacotripeptide-repeat region of PRORP domain-containing protein n=1 Tax=Blyttiomyces helicus TaxID=388810 RepID=A0A4V1IQM2_9FUNG|nr:hypothetical protein BDK51DRAFT_38374 [Blyttiomyces helicus]|eukprot:RKO87047.1 hypothetical protein BDK51DRAFT_38374 [Blyttiomyces helicus]